MSRSVAPLRPIDRIVQPFVALAHHSAAGSLLLLGATALALVIANSGWHEGYAHFWETRVPIAFAGAELDLTLHEWLNDVLMALFFLVVGIEIKRELTVGTLASPRAAALPILAAAGGMAAPALLYLLFNQGTAQAHGWGVPTATDIAFALGLLGLLAPGAPPALRAFLGALAIVDDLGAILVIALFYGGDINVQALQAAAVIIGLLVTLNLLGVCKPAAYLLLGVPLWLAVHAAGIHATVAGVLLAMTIPSRRPAGGADVIRATRRALSDAEDELENLPESGTEGAEQVALERIRDAYELLQSTSQRVERGLHGWIVVAILPLFAFANAGVRLEGSGLGVLATGPALGVIAGLAIGKPLGISLICFIAEKLGVATRPAGMTWPQLIATGALAGIGFTMAIFIANLAFTDPAVTDAAKLAILVASAIAAIVGGLAVRATTRPRPA